MRETRLITADEIDHLKTIFRLNPKAMRVVMTEEFQDKYLNRIREKITEGDAHVAVTFENGEPIVTYIGFVLVNIAGWHAGLSKITYKYNHYNKSAPIMADALDLLLEKMESLGYYKFWVTAPERHHNIRDKILCKHSKYLSRYKWFDETVIPAGEKSGVFSFDAFRRPVDWTDVVVRMYILDQQYRVEKLRVKGCKEYKGTVL